MTTRFFTESDFTDNDLLESMHGRVAARIANRLLAERGKVVYKPKYPSACMWRTKDEDGSVEQMTEGYRALLVQIEPLERDSYEKLVNDLVTLCEGKIGVSMNEWLERAKRLLETKGPADE